MVVDECHPVRVEKFFWPIPEAVDGKTHFMKHDHVWPTHCNVSRPHLFLTGRAGQYFLYRG